MGGRMWMGKRGRERWVPAPATGMTYGPKRWSSKTSFLSGGAAVRTSIASHLEYELDWNAISRDSARLIEDMNSGIDGTGLTYFLDPMAMDKNVLPAQWAFPALAALDGPVLWGNARPASVPTEANDLGYPSTSAQYTAKAKGTFRDAYSWDGAASGSVSTYRFDGSVAAKNFVQNPQADGGTSSLEAHAFSTVAMVDDAITGAGNRAYQIAATAAGQSSARLVNGQRPVAAAGDRWWARFAARWTGGYGARQISCYLRFLDSAGNTLQTAQQDVTLTAQGTFRRWTGAANASTSEEYTGATRRTNYVTNPSLAVDTAGWQATGTASGGAIVRDTTLSLFGAGSLKVTLGTADLSGAQIYCSNVPTNDAYTASAYVLAPAGLTFKLRLSNNTSLATQTVATGTGGWQRVSVVMPAASATAAPSVQILSNGAGTGGTVYVDGVMLEPGSTAGTYFDGSTVTPIQGRYRAWTGAADASASIDRALDGTGSINLLPNPAFRNGMTGYSTEPAISATKQADGAMRVVTTTGAAQSFVISNVPNNTDYTLVVVGRSFQGGGTAVYGGLPQGVRVPLTSDYGTYYVDLTTATQGNLYLSVISPGGNPTNGFDIKGLMLVPGKGYRGDYFDGSVVDPSVILPTGRADGVQQLAVTDVAPAGTAMASLFFVRQAYVGEPTSPAAGDTFNIGSVMLTQSESQTVPDYFTGSSRSRVPSDATPPTPRSKLYIPIPPGYTAWVGFHGIATGTGGLEVTPIPSEGLVADPVLPPILPVNSDTRVNTAFPGNSYSGIELRYGGGTSTAVTIAGAMVQILRDGKAPQNGGFISGQGHSGCEFDEAPQRQAYSAVVGPGFDGMVGLSAKLTETGDWI